LTWKIEEKIKKGRSGGNKKTETPTKREENVTVRESVSEHQVMYTILF
jgi:hypothetical protein